MALVLAFAAGIILGVVAFDLLPEIFELTHQLNIDPLNSMVALVIGFLAFHILEKTVLIHNVHEADYAEHHHPNVGIFSAVALILHSVMDGFSIGLGFQLSSVAGILITAAIIPHRFVDGLNVVALMLHNKNRTKTILQFLLIAALAPFAGVMLGEMITLPDKFILYYLGIFAGFLLYIGASDILPEAHSKKSSASAIFLTVFGVALIYVITRIALG